MTFSVEILQIVCFTPATYVSMKSSNKKSAISLISLYPFHLLYPPPDSDVGNVG